MGISLWQVIVKLIELYPYNSSCADIIELYTYNSTLYATVNLVQSVYRVSLKSVLAFTKRSSNLFSLNFVHQTKTFCTSK